jgi:hypothetical protein
MPKIKAADGKGKESAKGKKAAHGKKKKAEKEGGIPPFGVRLVATSCNFCVEPVVDQSI